MLGVLGSHSRLLRRRLTWAEMHFWRDQLMAELKTLSWPNSRPCHGHMAPAFSFTTFFFLLSEFIGCKWK